MYILFKGDGKHDIAPLKRKLLHLGVKEQGPHPEDKQHLSQGTLHKDRVFLPDKKDRDLFSELVTDSVPLKTFKSSKLIGTNAKLLSNIITRLSETTDELPDCYSSLVEELAKNSAVAGLLQSTTNKALSLLRMFCLKQINLTDCKNQSEIRLVQAQFPAFWEILNQICRYEKCSFLPSDVSSVVLEILKIRRNTFKNATVRYAEDYIKFEEPGRGGRADSFSQ